MIDDKIQREICADRAKGSKKFKEKWGPALLVRRPTVCPGTCMCAGLIASLQDPSSRPTVRLNLRDRAECRNSQPSSKFAARNPGRASERASTPAMAAVLACGSFAPRLAHNSEVRPSLAACSSCSVGIGALLRNARLKLGLERRARRMDVARASADDNVDDEGVVKDMERYLNEISVEYENVWDTKPAWCQPWTIVLTGVGGIGLSWLVIKSTFVTGLVSVLVAAWWYVFLYTYPLAYSAMIAERRQNQKNGTEDTFGLRTRKE